MTAIQKQSKIDFTDGFVPLYGTMNSSDHSIFPDTIRKNNQSVDKIVKLCEERNINLLFFCAPYCTNIENKQFTKLLEKRVPNFKDYSTLFKSDSLFKDCGHLNEIGAKKFTALFAKENLN